MPRPSSFLAIAATALAAAEARGEPPPIRVDYQAHEGCPAADGFLDEIRWRTRLARLAEPDEEALLVQARVTRRGAVSSGRLSLGEGKARTIEDPSCDEVVSALALITALAIDPRASTGPRPPVPAPAPAPAAPLPAPPPDPPLRAAAPPPPEIVPAPLPVIPPPSAAPPAPRRWMVGARASAAFSVTPRPLLGGGVFVERAEGGASLRLAIELAATGELDAGPGGASFLRGAGRIEGCAFTVRPASWLRLVPCVGAEGGALRGQGILRGSLTHVEQTTVPWAGLGFVPRLGIDVGIVVVEAQGGPVFPLVRRTFVFDGPDYLIHAVAPVTWTTGLGAGVHFP
jgi:hypothetical protein